MTYVKASDPDMVTEALNIVGSVSFRQGNFAAALPVFEHLFKQTGKAGCLFNLIITSAMLGRVKRIGTMLAELESLASSGDTEDVPPQAFVWYHLARALCHGGNPATAIPLISKLRQPYEQLRETDHQFLLNRGVPASQATVELAMYVFRAVGDRPGALQWMKALWIAVDEDGKALLKGFGDQLSRWER